MSNGSMNRTGLLGVLVVVAVLFAALQLTVVPKDGASLLVTLTFWTMLAQGCVALAAVAELAKGLWLIPIRRDLLAAYPMLLFLALLYLLIGTRVDSLYVWSEHPTVWLEAKFFIIRNVALLLLCFWTGRGLTNAIVKNTDKRGLYATLYVCFWVISQSLIAFDWIMSLEYPWISTLFGGFFFVQSLLMGMLVSVYIIFFRKRAGDTGLTETLRDTAKMTLGFCFMWGGFFFAQYLVIWYGNIPEEVSYVYKRVMYQPYLALSIAMLLMIFAIPFLTLILRRVKTMPWFMLGMANLIFAGIMVELYVMVAPVKPVPLLWLLIESALVAVAFTVLMRGRESFMPKGVTGSAGGKSGADDVGDLAAAHHH